MKYRAVLVENEEHSRARLRRLLAAFPERVQIVGEAADGPAAASLLREVEPDLLFLDIDLPGQNGFEVLDQLDAQPTVVFTTAFNQQALEAFRTHAVEYLLKPIEEQALEGVFIKLESPGFDEERLAGAVRQLLSTVSVPYLARVTCKIGDRTVFVKPGEITYFQADSKCTAVHTANSEYLIDTPLIELESKLDPRDFVRIHRATLVNIAWVAQMRRTFDGKLKVLLRDAKSTELLASRMFAENLRNL